MKIKYQQAGRSLAAGFLLVMALFLTHRAEAQITGDTLIAVKTWHFYDRPQGTADLPNGQWQCGNPHVQLSNPFNDNVVLYVDEGITTGSVYLSYQKPTSSGLYITIGKVIKILPLLRGPAVAYPGESPVYTVYDYNGHTGCSYLWTISPGSVCTTCGPSGTSTQITTIPTSSTPAGITASCTISGCISSMVTNTVVTDIILHNPKITGPHSIGCESGVPPASYTFYSDYQPGSNYYKWTVPSYLTIVSGGGAGDNYVTVVENAIHHGPGGITLQTFNDSGLSSSVRSGIVSWAVEVCCVSSLMISTNVNAPSVDQQQSALEIVAYNTIAAGAGAMYHAGGTVKLTTGFHAEAGSYFHGYIRPCDGSFSIAVNDEDEISGEEMQLEEYAIDLPVNDEIVREPEAELRVFPNPTNGIFRVKTSFNGGLPDQIVVRDAMGTLLQTIDHPQSFETTIDLGEHSAGVYFIGVSYATTVLNGKIVKNQ